MIDLENKIVFITGASSGIGASCARAFAKAGARLILCARRGDRVKSLARSLEEEFGAAVHAFPLDVRERGMVESAIASLPVEWRAVDVLVNNAGLSRGLDKLHEGLIEDWEEMIDTNVKGLLYVSRAVIPGMVERGAGTIVNIGSIAGQEVYPGGNVYCASKHAVDAITKGLRMDLVDTPVRVCTVDPGLVETEFSLVRYHGDADRAKKTYAGMRPLGPDDVADAVFYAATRPAHVSVNQIVIMPAAQAAAMVVHRTSPPVTPATSQEATGKG